MQYLRQLPRFKERSFYLKEFTWEVSEIEACYDELLEQKIDSEAEAICWINKWQELSTLTLDENTIRLLQIKSDTENRQYETESNFFTQNVFPKIKEKEFLLQKKIFKNSFLNQYLKQTKAFCFKQMETDYQLFREENIPISVELGKRNHQYTKILGNQTLLWEGKTVTTQSLQTELVNPSSEIRKEIWLTCAKRQYEDKQTIDTIFDKMISLRKKEAKNAGYEDVIQYHFDKRHRYDYTPQDCRDFHALVLQYFLPIEQKLSKIGMKNLKQDSWHLWDMTVDILGSQRIKPFEDATDLTQKTLKTFSELDFELGSFFSKLVESKTLDLENRPGKRPGCFQVPLLEANIPFIFMNIVGISKDVTLFFHEIGHAFHVLFTKDLELLDRNVSRDFSEIASMTMELIPLEHLENNFGKAQAKQLKRDQLVHIPKLMLRVACIDEFEQWIYGNNESQSAEAREQKWLELMEKYYPHLNFKETEKLVASSWQNVLHLFSWPFYMLDYGFAQLGAIQFWEQYSQNKSDAIKSYKKALKAGGTLGFKEILERSDLEFPINEKVIARLSKKLSIEIDAILK